MGMGCYQKGKPRYLTLPLAWGSWRGLPQVTSGPAGCPRGKCPAGPGPGLLGCTAWLMWPGIAWMTQEGNYPALVLPALWDLVGSRGCHRVSGQHRARFPSHMPLQAATSVCAQFALLTCRPLALCLWSGPSISLSIAVPCWVPSCPSWPLPLRAW